MRQILFFISLILLVPLSPRSNTTVVGETQGIALGQIEGTVAARRMAAFNKGRELLLEMGVPFEPNELLNRRWRQTLAPNFAQTPEMSRSTFNTGRMKGAILADTLHVPEEVALDGDTVILARRLVFEGKDVLIRGPHNIYLFVMGEVVTQRLAGEATGKGRLTIDTSGRGRREWLAAKKSGMGSCEVGYDDNHSRIGRPRPQAFQSQTVLSQYIDTSGGPGWEGYSGDQGSDGQAGNPGSSGGNGWCETVNSHHGIDGNAGGNGSNGTSGTAGQNGGNGEDAGTIDIDVWDGSGYFVLIANGGDGGNGGHGGSGGNGGDGGAGGNSGNGADCSCNLYGAGNGGNGGNGGDAGKGGNGGTGGDGGRGGNGGNIYVRVWTDCEYWDPYVDNKGGWGGAGGEGGGAGQNGTPGIGGVGGIGGTNYNCSTMGPGQPGQNGSNGGYPEMPAPGNNGSVGYMGAGGNYSPDLRCNR